MDVASAEGEALDFAQLSLSSPILRGLADHGFARPSPIQARAIPLGRFGVDLIAQAKSGTGKTLVFVVIALELMQADGPAPQACIVAPTREIALQSRDVCRSIGSHVPGMVCHAFVGGTPMKSDVKQCASCLIACGTPGRLVGLMLCEALVASHVRLLVLDEADKLCDEGFESQLRYLLTALPERKQTLAFSATYPPALLETLRSSMRSPLMVSLLPRVQHSASTPSRGASDRATAEDAGATGDVRGNLVHGSGANGRFIDPDMEDLSDPLALLERPATLGCQAQAQARPLPALDPSSPTGEEDEGELVGRAALQNVRQCYQVVNPGDGGRHRGGSSSRAAASTGEGEPRPGGAIGAMARAKQVEVLRLLDTLSFHQAIVFCNQIEHATPLCDALNASGFPSALISGSLAQAERTATMRRMRAFHLRVLVATDLLARGVDFGRVTLVLHYGLPRDLPTYLHRVGRTGRYAARGLSVLLLPETEVPAAQALLAPLAVRVHPLPLILPESAYMDDEAPGSLTTTAVERGTGVPNDASGGARGTLTADPREPSADETATKRPTAPARDADSRLRELKELREAAKSSSAERKLLSRGETVRRETAVGEHHAHRPLQSERHESPLQDQSLPSPKHPQEHRHRQRQHQHQASPSLPPPTAAPQHASAQALEHARARGRERAYELARQRARERYGLPSSTASIAAASSSSSDHQHQLDEGYCHGSAWWEGLVREQ